MGDYTKEDARYIEGQLDGLVRAASIESTENTDFDWESWEDLYGADILYADVPAYPSEEAKRKGEDPLEIMDWDHDREIATLVSNSTPPTDRTGSLIFTDRTVATNRMGSWQMFMISEDLYHLIGTLREARMEILDEVYP